MPLSRHLCFGLFAACLCAALSGCRGVNPTAEQLVIRELREQEDYIYELEDQLDEYETALHSARRQNESLQRQVGKGKEAAGSDDGAGSILKRRREGGLFPNLRKRDAKGAPAPAAPEIEMGEESAPQPDGPALGPPANGATADEAALHGGPADARAAKLVINRQLTGGASGNPRSNASPGLTVVFEPRNAQDQLVPPQGAVAVVAIDPAIPGAAGRLGRWDFAADEAAKTYRKTLYSKGYHLELHWPGAPPRSDRVQLHVRLTLADGAQLHAESLISVQPVERQARRDAPARPTTDASPAAEPPAGRNGARNRLVDRLGVKPLGGHDRESGTRLPKVRTARSQPEWSPYR